MNSYFYDLHVHSCLSPCADDDMTPNNIAGMAVLNGLQMVALTDHNSCKNCPAFFEACRRQGIVPIAGMELSTAEDIHLICLFEELEQAMCFDQAVETHLRPIPNNPNIFGNQLILNGEDEEIGQEENLLISATDLWMQEAIRLARSYGAHVHPAHIDRESNGIVAVLGDIPSEYRFDFFEFNQPEMIESYQRRFPYIDTSHILVCSDAHHLWEIGEASYAFGLEDEPYSSALVRRRLFELFNNGSTCL